MDILIEERAGKLWVAALQDGRLEGLEIDAAYEGVRWGAVYYAKVKTLDPALDAAYVDLNGHDTALLYNKDTRFIDEHGYVRKGGDIPISKRLHPGQMIPVQAKSVFLPQADGEQKLPQVSMDITLPGRFLIFGPQIGTNQISRRIQDKKMRKQLLAMLDQIEGEPGYILRAAAEDMQTDVLLREAQILRNTWDKLQEQLNGDTPKGVMAGPDAVQRTLSDQAMQSIERIEVVTMEHLRYVEDWCSVFAPDLMPKVAPVELPDAEEDLALFHERDIFGQIESLFQPYVLLPGGGSIIIQDTAALTAIDVNTGGDKRGKLAVNLEAAEEVARQIRLRNIGGIVITDFLKPLKVKDEGRLIATLEDAILQDPCTVQIHGKTALGLMEMTRKRRTPPLEERFTDYDFEI